MIGNSTTLKLPKFNIRIILLACFLLSGIMLIHLFPPLYMTFPQPMYLTLHIILEFLSVVISVTVFIVAWYNFQQTENISELVICLTFLSLSIINFAHGLSYDGMPDFFTSNSANKASTYWIFSRVIRAVGMLAAVATVSLYPKRKVNPVVWMILTIIVVSAILVIVAGYPQSLPYMYFEEEKRQTELKVFFEYIGILIEAGALIILVFRKKRDMYRPFLETSLILLIFSSIAFTLYSSAFDTYNLIGHVYMIAAFVFILRGLFVGSVVKLYEANRILQEQKRKLGEINSQLAMVNQMKSDFLANTNHELRTPLTAIIAFTELLMDESTGPLNPVQRDYLNEISESGLRLLVDINNLLDHSKVEGGQMKLHTEKLMPGEVIAQAVRQMKPIFLQKQQHLTVSPGEGLPTIEADREKVLKILINLLSNASKFTSSGGVIIISTSITDDRDSVVISVSDDGPGLQNEEAEHVFEKFYQGIGRAQQQGTGLGLNLVKHFVELHGGQVWVVGGQSRGCTFSFSVPVNGVNVVNGEVS